jgi:hypothetical protein
MFVAFAATVASYLIGGNFLFKLQVVPAKILLGLYMWNSLVPIFAFLRVFFKSAYFGFF